MSRYIFFDDEVGSSAYADRLRDDAADLEVVSFVPHDVTDVTAQLSTGHFEGALLDIAFDHAVGDRPPLQIDGLSLAQHIRSLQKRKALAEFPIIRLSQPDREALYVGGDTTSNDLFDACLSKEDLLAQHARFTLLLVSLAMDYPILSRFSGTLQNEADISEVLGVSDDFLDVLDSRILLGLTHQNAPAHTIARFVIAKLLSSPGPLVPEELLAIRLGVDITASGDAWGELVSHLTEAKYKGCFAAGYPRWWWPKISSLWSHMAPEAAPIARLTANERVARLSAATNLQSLVAIEPQPGSPGERFWTRCISTRLPVDPQFGYPLQTESGHQPWQDVDYYCQDAALRHLGSRRLGIVEREKLRRLKKERKEQEPTR